MFSKKKHKISTDRPNKNRDYSLWRDNNMTALNYNRLIFILNWCYKI